MEKKQIFQDTFTRFQINQKYQYICEKKADKDAQSLLILLQEKWDVKSFESPVAQEKHFPNTPNYKQEIANGKKQEYFLWR